MSARSRVVAYAAVYMTLAGAFVLAGGADDSLLCDDAFYYFQIARHAAAGHGFTFDGLHATNGFHPLWAWLCVPIWRLFGDDPWRPIHAALLVLVAATAATALVVARIGRALSDSAGAARNGGGGHSDNDDNARIDRALSADAGNASIDHAVSANADDASIGHSDNNRDASISRAPSADADGARIDRALSGNAGIGRRHSGNAGIGRGHSGNASDARIGRALSDTGDACIGRALSDTGDACIGRALSADAGDACIGRALSDTGDACIGRALSADAGDACIGRAGSDSSGDATGEHAALLFLLSPFTLLIPLRGCEASLSALTLALATYAACRYARRPSLPAAACLGLATGAAGLARTDHVLFGASMMIFVIITNRSWRTAVIFAAVALATVAPWLVWSAVRCGTIVQVSGAAKRAIDLYGRLPPVRSVAVAARNLGHAFVIAAGWVSGEEWRPKRYTGVVLAATAAQLIVAARAGRRRPSPRALWPLYAYCALHLAVYAWYYRAYYTWYALPLALAVALFCGERVRSPRTWRAVVALAAIASVVALARFGARGPFRRHGAALAQAALLADVARLPAGSRVGLENAGAAGYFVGYARPDVTIVNLDCVVNNAAFAAWRRHDYAGWLLANVDWVERAPDSRFLGDDAIQFESTHVRAVPDMQLFRVVNEAP